MGQIEVYEYLLKQRKLNPEKWFSAKEIKIALEKKGCNRSTITKVHTHLLKMSNYNIVQMKGQGLVNHFKVFRACID